ncbi:MAG: phage portal protein [Gaiellaceae bacterium]
MPFWRREPEQRTLAALDLRPYVPLSTIAPATALQNVDVWACVRVLSDAAASCPLLSYRRLADGNRRRASNRTAELLRAPAEGTTQAAFVSTVMAHLLLHGNAYLGKYRDEDGRVEQLLPIAPERVQVERRHGRIVFTVSNDRGHQTEHGLEDVVHVKALSTDGVSGLSPIRMMRAALELNNAVREAATGLFANGARPSGILKVSATGDRDQVERLKKEWGSRHGGDRQGGIAVIAGEIGFEPIAMSADDAQFIQARKLSATEIARAFRIPPWMVGAEDGGSLTYSNTESQSLAFVSYSLRPWLVAIEQALTADRDLYSASTFCEFLIDGLLRADSKTRAEVYAIALDPLTGWLRRDEVRRLENLAEETTADLLGLPSLNGQGAIA